ncbi:MULTISPECIES: virulence RhuM family protein [unclassified Paenibacillus]|uniref:virulence RhuM family protein n=1 Tax=unclassified Paenibacillus TaxID=185978 RepID=UPI0009C7DD40|nr:MULTISPECIES: RhuM family protein [unclassified Paenibacillus]SLK14797.1 Virulence protein RhuM family protein [Paenibacillus sp. RU5A]SOC73661.1 Virulence protein RhuM family protein [Paenibacillus sp. RU26A]SOC75836.1 Virulence protein RhuM family protein [Paenibacillus sp. RU5M]
MDNLTGILMYQTEDGNTKIDVKLENGTVWMSQKAVAELYQTTPQNITLHIKNIYQKSELASESTCKEYLQVQTEGSREIKHKVKHYNLELIVAVGYRVRSHRGTQFRRWVMEYAEDQAEHQSPMYMKDWIEKLNLFPKFNEREILTDGGKISQEVA